MSINLWHAQSDDYKAFRLAKRIAAVAANKKITDKTEHDNFSRTGEYIGEVPFDN